MGNASQPDRFRMYIGGFPPSCTVEWKTDRLVFSSGVFDQETIAEIIPSEAEWRKFWRALDRIGVWSWKQDYGSSGALDGTCWEVEIEANGRHVRSKGANTFPDESDEDGVFGRLTAAVQKLIKSDEFR